MEDWKSNATVFQAVCLWLDQVSTESPSERIERLACTARWLSDPYAWKCRWELRHLKESKELKVYNLQECAINTSFRSLWPEYDKAIDQLNFEIAIHVADQATVRSRLIEAGVELRPRRGWKY